MQSKFLVKFITITLLVLNLSLFAQHDPKQLDSKNSDVKNSIKADIQHHLLDSHDFNLFKNSETGKYFGFPLPIILWDNGLHFFSSSKLNHGKSVAESNGNYYKLYHNKIYRTDANGTIEYNDKHKPSNIKPFDFSITKSVVMIILTGILLLLLFGGLAKSLNKNPIAKGAGRFFEPIVIYIRDEIAKPNIGEKKYKKFMPYLLTIFFFVWFLNLFGLTPLGVNVTGNIAVTFALAMLTFIITQFSGNKNYWKHIFWMPGVPTPMKILLAPIELLGVFIKPFSLLIRLYANIMAGHIILMSIIGLIFVFQNWIGSSLTFLLAFALFLLELLVAALQAYIFTMLSALYFGAAVAEDDH